MIRGSHTSAGLVNLPPRKKKVFKKALRITFLLVGTVPSKKNRQLADAKKGKIYAVIRKYNRPCAALFKELKEVKPFIRNSVKYLEWEEKAIQEVKKQSPKWEETYAAHGFHFPIKKASISIYHYWADIARRDNSNKMETINDLLKKAGIITDDTWANLSPIKSDADCYKGEIRKHITEITLTAYSWRESIK